MRRSVVFRPVQVVDVELSEPLPDFEGLERYGAVQALVRLHGRPVASLRLPVEEGRLPAASLERAVFGQGCRSLVEALLEEEMARDEWRLPDRLPLVTAAVCTRDRTEDLASCLEALERLDHPALDLLVIDNAPSDDATERLVRERHPRVRYCREPRPGLDWARNRAVLEARGEIVAFTDDDARVDPRWARAIAEVFADHPEVMAVTGLVAPYELETEAQTLFETYGGFGRGFRRQWFHAPPRPGYGPHIGHLGAGRFGTGANMAYRRSLFDRVGLFDPALDVGTVTNGGGDLEMFFRVLQAGHTLVYEPRALVFHRHRREYGKLREQIANNGVGFYSFLVRTAFADPEERAKCLRFGTWWLGWWSVKRLLRSCLAPDGFPRDLILAELWGSLRGLPRYRRARRAAEEIARRHGAELPPPEATRAVPVPRRPMAVRLVDCDQIAPLTDVGEYTSVRVFFGRDGAVLGHVDIAHYGGTVSAARLRDEIAPRLVDGRLQGAREEGIERRCRDLLATAGPLLPRPARARTRPVRLSPETSVSIVVATRDRPEALRECLASLVVQESPRDFEIVVVDNHPASGLTPPVVAEFPGIVLVDEPRAGLSYARNRGFAASRGEILVATDDDVVAPKGWLEALVAPFTRADVVAVTGNVLPRELETESQRLFEAYGGLGRGYQGREYDRRYFDRFRIRAVPTWHLGATANAAFRASIFADPGIGLLDEALGAGMPTGVGEDTYLFYKVLKAGFTLVYEPAAWVWHRHRTDPEGFRKQIFAYSKGHVAYHLTTLFRDRDPRALSRIALGLPRAHLSRIARRLLGKGHYPVSMVLLEAWGNLLGPWALFQARRRVRREGRSAGYGRRAVSPSTAEAGSG
jgi:GT2 family glycosyltransferase